MKPVSVSQNVVQSAVRAILSLGGHSVAVYILFADSAIDADQVPEWLVGLFALVITWYFATGEGGGNRPLPHWQGLLRGSVRAIHVVGGGAVVAVLLLTDGVDAVPPWWVAVYVSILTFYFIELRDPPREVGEPEAETS